jgi:hypothetical protein
MSNGLKLLTRFVAFLCELVVLAMFYSAAMLAPVPFDWERITAILLTATVSGTFAYISSSGFPSRAKCETFTWKRLVLKPPFLIWIAALGFTGIQFLWALNMYLMATKK